MLQYDRPEDFVIGTGKRIQSAIFSKKPLVTWG
jgi:hypothetical protein